MTNEELREKMAAAMDGLYPSWPLSDKMLGGRILEALAPLCEAVIAEKEVEATHWRKEFEGLITIAPVTRREEYSTQKRELEQAHQELEAALGHLEALVELVRKSAKFVPEVILLVAHEGYDHLKAMRES